MGIKSFTKVFEYNDEFAYKSFKNKNVVIDASMELYRAALGLKTINTLTDSSGNPTAHINTILLGVVLKLKAAGANQYWVFDYNTHAEDGIQNHNPLKQLELAKRKLKKNTAQDNVKRLTKQLEKKATIVDELFSEDEDDDDKEPSITVTTQDEIQSEIDKQQKAAFTLKSFYIEDVKFILDMLDIPWIECPAGFDAEQIAAFTTTDRNIFGKTMDYVLSQDMDSLLFGAKVLIKRDLKKKKLFKYELAKILKDYKLTHDELIKVGLILGTDFADKTPKIGPKTVLKKYKEVVLSDAQKKAYDDNFTRQLTDDELSSIHVTNVNMMTFTDNEKYTKLIDWIVMIKGFNRERITKQFKKHDLFI